MRIEGFCFFCRGVKSDKLGQTIFVLSKVLNFAMTVSSQNAHLVEHYFGKCVYLLIVFLYFYESDNFEYVKNIEPDGWKVFLNLSAVKWSFDNGHFQ